MGLRGRLGRGRDDRALVVGLLGGVIASLTGIVVYYVVPYATGDAASLFDAVVTAPTEFTGFPPLYHVVALLVAPFVCTLAGVLAIRRRGLHERRDDAKVFAGVVALPLASVVVMYLLTAVVFGVRFGLGVAGPVLTDQVRNVFGYTLYSLAFGVISLLVVGGAAVVGESVGAGAGYLLARRLTGRPDEGDRSLERT